MDILDKQPQIRKMKILFQLPIALQQAVPTVRGLQHLFFYLLRSLWTCSWGTSQRGLLLGSTGGGLARWGCGIEGPPGTVGLRAPAPQPPLSRSVPGLPSSRGGLQAALCRVCDCHSTTPATLHHTRPAQADRGGEDGHPLDGWTA